jgi:hypothetical protein
MVIFTNSLFDSQTVFIGDNNGCLLGWPVILRAEAGMRVISKLSSVL